MDQSSEKSKKIPLEELDKEDLIKRCKNYLALAQKAKAAKDGKFVSIILFVALITLF